MDESDELYVETEKKLVAFLRGLSEAEREAVALLLEDAFKGGVVWDAEDDDGDAYYYCVDVDFLDAFEYLLEGDGE